MSEIYQPFGQNSPIVWKWIVMSGKDAASFLQRLSTVQVTSLSSGEGKPGCFLTPLGHIESCFQLWKLSDEEFAFEFDSGSQNEKWQTKLFHYVDSHTFREDLKLSNPASSNECWWIFPDAEALSSFQSLGLKENQTTLLEEIRLSDHGSTHFGKKWITAWGRPIFLSQWLDRLLTDHRKLTFSELDHWRIGQLQPTVDFEITEKVLPLEIGLKRAIADQKGCYPGQEVIEKIISRGAPARRLIKLEGKCGAVIPQIGFLIQDPQTHQEVGRLTSLFIQSDQWVGLGVVRKTHAENERVLSLRETSVSPLEVEGKVTQVSADA